MIISIATTEASIIIATICPVFICASAGVSFLFFVLHILHTRKFLYIFFQLYFMAVVSKKWEYSGRANRYTLDKLMNFKITFTQSLCLLRGFSHVQLFGTPWTEACQAPLSMGFSRQEYGSGLPCPPPGAFPHPGMEPGSPALQADSLPSEPPGKPLFLWGIIAICIVQRRERKPREVKEFVEEHTAGNQWSKWKLGLLAPRWHWPSGVQVQGHLVEAGEQSYSVFGII